MDVDLAIALWLVAFERSLISPNRRHILMISIVDSKEPKNTAIEIVNNEEISLEDERDRLRLERQVERAFYAAGCALRELRDRKLYRSTHKTFKEYCKERFGFARRHSYRLIDASVVVDNILQMCPDRTQNSSDTSDTNQTLEIIPTSEWQIRSLTKLEPQQQREIWRQAIEMAKGRVPSGKVVSDLVAKIEGKSISDKSQVGSDNKNENNKQIEEGVNYIPGMGCEFYVRLNQETWNKLNEYAEYVGTASLNGAVTRLLSEVYSEVG